MRYPASLAHEKVDATSFSEWGMDFLKYDNCYSADPAEVTHACGSKKKNWTLIPKKLQILNPAPQKKCRTQSFPVFSALKSLSVKVKSE